MKNKGFEAWKARLDYMGKEFPFSSKEEGIIQIRNEDGNLHADHQPAFVPLPVSSGIRMVGNMA